MSQQSPEPVDAREYQHWPRVYAIVIIYTAALIGGLWLFSNTFR